MVGQRRKVASLWHVLQWAFLAEVVLQVCLPLVMRGVYSLPGSGALLSLVPEGVNVNIVALNHIGAVLAGLVTALAEAPDARAHVGSDSDSDGGLQYDPDDEQQDSLIPCAGKHGSNGGGPYHWKGRLGPTFSQRCADAFTRGFVAVMTSYLAAVEHTGELLGEGDHVGAAFVFLGSFVGGPALFTVAVLVGKHLSRWFWSRARSDEPESTEELRRRLVGAQLLLSISIVLISTMGMILEASGSLSFIGAEPMRLTFRAPGPGQPGITLSAPSQEGSPLLLWWQLPCGLLSVAIALVISDRVTIIAKPHTDKLQRHVPDVNCLAAVVNVATLVCGHAFVMFESFVFEPDSLARMLKVHSSLGGTLSAYNGFTEAVAWPALAGNWRRAFVNWMVHAFLSAVGAYFVSVAY